MNNNTNFIIELLSAGVIAALITGVFSLLIAIKNNIRLLELEKNKQKFVLEQEKFKGFRNAYDELLELLPEDKRLGFVIMNLPSREDFQENGLSDSYEIAENNMKIMHSHFQKYCYLLSNNEQEKVTNFIGNIDNVTQSIIDLRSNLQIYKINKNEELDKSYKLVHEKVIERIIKVTEFEEMYYDLFKSNLSELSNINPDN